MINKLVLLNRKQILKAIENVFQQRTQDILVSRFGLKDGQRQTLEQIGRKYGITRERVRQIEEAAFCNLRKPVFLNSFKNTFFYIDSFLNKEGRMSREERLFSHLTGAVRPNRDWGAAFFVLTLGKPYHRYVESDKFYSFWANSPNVPTKADNLISQLVQELKKKGEAVPLDFIFRLAKSGGLNLSKRVICSYLDATKKIEKNCFGRYGLVQWPEVSPRGAKDKAYIVLKEQSRPLHFQEISRLINQANLGLYPAQAQTVHNELIKDDRFVLVGRGTYALKEWGHRTGTVKDVICQILRENGSMSKEEILKDVLKERLVKKNTVFINLQNKKHFRKDKQGRYFLLK